MSSGWKSFMKNENLWQAMLVSFRPDVPHLHPNV
jgi:hypothetical protein